MFNLEIENIEKWIRENHPGMAEDKWRLTAAAWAVHDSMPWHAHTGIYCNGEQVYWERDPYRRVWVCPVCGETERDARHVYGSEKTPEVLDWTAVERRVDAMMA